MVGKTERIILIAEDDPPTQISWEQDIREYNRDSKAPVRFVAEYAKTKLEAIQHLSRVRIDCAVIDLRLPVGEKTTDLPFEATGNVVLEKVLVETAVPAVVYSGYTAEASDLVRNSQIKIIEKKIGGGPEALRWLAQHEALMSAMASMRKRVEREAARLFSQSIWPRWEKTWNTMTGMQDLAGVITRQVVAHVAEELSLPPNFHHPEEFYFVPPLVATQLGTGDLLRIDGEVYVVVTPRCNMARKYPKHLMLGHCAPMKDELEKLREELVSTEKKIKKQAAIDLRNFATQGHAIATHFLPPCGEDGPWLVQFKDIMTVKSEEAPKLLAGRFASIAPQFVPNLVQRYAAYLGRIGQPDLDCDTLADHICK